MSEEIQYIDEDVIVLAEDDRIGGSSNFSYIFRRENIDEMKIYHPALPIEICKTPVWYRDFALCTWAEFDGIPRIRDGGYCDEPEKRLMTMEEWCNYRGYDNCTQAFEDAARILYEPIECTSEVNEK